MKTRFIFDKSKNVCPKEVEIDLDEENIIQNVEFTGGCSGNLKMICKMIQGKSSKEVIELFEGNTCGNKDTSCCNELAEILKLITEEGE